MSEVASRALPRLLGIIDASLCARTGLDLVELARTVVEAGLPFLWLRCRTLTPEEHLRLAGEVSRIAGEADVPLVVSDRADIARVVGCGVHVPARGLPVAACRRVLSSGALVGVSAHGWAELEKASGADYATLSPVHESLSKPGHAPSLAPPELRALARRAAVPVFALGGVNASDADLIPDFHGLALMGPLHGLSAVGPAEVVSSCVTAIAARVGDRALET